MPGMANFSPKESCMPSRKYSLLLAYLDHIGAILLELAKFCSMDTLELCSDILQPGGQLDTRGLVLITYGFVKIDIH